MTTDDTEYEEPARGDKAEAIRRKYCLENDQVYDANGNDIYDNIAFFKSKDSCGDAYLCYEEDGLDIIVQNGKVFYIHRVKE